jgi:hypothetical protein
MERPFLMPFSMPASPLSVLGVNRMAGKLCVVKAGVMTSRFGIGRPNQTNGKKQPLRTSAMKTPTKPRRNPGDPNADIVNAG